MRGQDVDEMLCGMPSEKFDELVAMNEVIPFGDEKVCWVLANVGATLVNRVNRLCEAWGIEGLKESNPRDFIPWLKKKKPKPRYVNPNAAAAAFLLRVNR